jgi:hypothetical protein
MAPSFIQILASSPLILIWRSFAGRLALNCEDNTEDSKMLDLILIAAPVVFFILSWWYVKGCDRV